MDDLFKSKQYVIEHTLVMYAKDMAIVTPQLLYEPISDERTKKIIEGCHIYVIGIAPRVDIVDVEQQGDFLCFTFDMAGKRYPKKTLFQLRPNSVLNKEPDGSYFVLEQDGKKRAPSPYDILMAIKKHVAPFHFKVLYIGQAYGEDGERSAIDRLMSHSTLQKISLTEPIPEGYRLEIILIGIENSFQLVTAMNPFAQNHKSTPERITNGLDFLFGTNEAQRVSLYEAALIRYFQPKYNTHFKDSFPSTNLKILEQCYDKDMQAVVAEINFSPFLYDLYSDSVSVKSGHIAHFDIHTEESRKSFFSPS